MLPIAIYGWRDRLSGRWNRKRPVEIGAFSITLSAVGVPRKQMGMGVQDVIVLSVVALAAGYMVLWVWRTLTASGGCHCNRTKENPTSSRGLKRVPLITPDQIGKPHISVRETSSVQPGVSGS